MKKTVLILVILILTGMELGAVEYRSSGLAFLRVKPDARTTAMGGAGTALRPDGGSFTPSLFILNPAIRVDSLHTTAQIGHSFWLAGSGIEFLGIAFPGGAGQWGLFITSANMDDFELREDRATDDPLGYFGAHYLHGGVSGNYRVNSSLAVGVRASVLYEKIYHHQAAGGSFTAGAQYKITRGLTAGLTLNHLGAMSELREESTPLPSSVRGGLSYDIKLMQQQLKLLLLADGGYYFQDQLFGAGGLELTMWDQISARFGISGSDGDLRTSFGGGFRWKRLRVDYGLWLDDAGLGTPHQISVSLGLN